MPIRSPRRATRRKPTITGRRRWRRRRCATIRRPIEEAVATAMAHATNGDAANASGLATVKVNACRRGNVGWRVHMRMVDAGENPRRPGAELLLPSSFAQSKPPPTGAPTTIPSDTTKAPKTLSREVWQNEIARRPQPKKGCFKSTYPQLEWQEVPCATAPTRLYPPARGHRSETVGNSNDFAAEVIDWQALSGRSACFRRKAAFGLSLCAIIAVPAQRGAKADLTARQRREAVNALRAFNPFCVGATTQTPDLEGRLHVGGLIFCLAKASVEAVVKAQARVSAASAAVKLFGNVVMCTAPVVE